MEREEARQTLLNEELDEDQAETILKLTHCDPPESFVIASQDMIGKSGVWGHFGAWNFTKADIWQNTRGLSREASIEYMDERFEIEEDEATNLYLQMTGINSEVAADAWIGPWHGFSGGQQGCSRSGELVGCGDGLIINTTDYNAWFPTAEGDLHPLMLVYPTPEGELIKKVFTNNTIPQQLAILAIPRGDAFNTVVASPELIDGMFAKMFYLEGHSLKYFKLLTRQTGFTGTDVWIWQVDWEGKQENIMPALRVVVPPTEVAQGNEVTLSYTGYFENGTVFDSSINNAENITSETPLNEYTHNSLTFTVGQNAVIPGFERGVLGAKLNEERILTINPGEGYNQVGHPLCNKT